MRNRLAAAVTAFWSGLTAGQKAGLRLQTLITTATLALLCSQPALAATPAGTVISNTASINYSISGVPGPTLNSNTDQFTVISTAPTNSAIMTLGTLNNTLYAGTTHNVTLDLTNTGSNILANHQIRITTPLNSQVVLTGTGVTLISNTIGATSVTTLFQVPDLSPSNTQNFQIVLTLPLAVDPNNNQMLVEQIANNITLNSQSLTLYIMNRSNGTLEIMRYSHSDTAVPVVINATLYKHSDGSYSPTAAPELPDAPGVLVTAAPVSLEPYSQFSHQQTLFISVTDPDQNLDSNLQESVIVNLNIGDSGESETLQLFETSTDSGTFTGYAILKQSAVTLNDGILDVHPNAKVDLNYSDKVDSSDTNTSIVLIDPYGVLFDSATGEKLNGYTVQMVNSDTDLPATVYGDDGVSSYPATMITGNAVTDSSGHVYTYATGEYRFPFAPAGNYKLVVTVPSGAQYTWPSTKSTELLYKLPVNDLVITLGSRGEIFPLLPGPPLHIDIPVDPLTAQIYIQRSANKDSIAAGDFVQYHVSLENVTAVSLNGVVLTETLPHGIRLQRGSVLIDGTRVSDPVISADGTTFNFELGAMASGEIHNIEYIAAVGAIKQGLATSRSHAIANFGAAESNHAKHEAKVLDELMHNRALLMGQVVIDGTGNDGASNKGLSGARIYMEDGRYAITDERGMFHFDNVTPGSHVVQLDLDTIPEEYEVVPTESNTRFAGRAWSQFVDVQGGTLWHTDFHIASKSAPTGKLSMQISNKPLQKSGDITYQIAIEASTVPVSNMRLTVMIPEKSQYKPGSSTFGGQAIEDPIIVSNKMLTWTIGSSDSDLNKSLLFTINTNSNDDTKELITKGYITFDTAAKTNQRLPITTHILALTAGKQESKGVREEFLFNPRYRLGGTTLNKEEREALDKIVNKVKHLKNIRIHAIGHSDIIPVEKRETLKTYGDNYRLSESRANEVAEYLRQQLQLARDSITIEGKGSDQPVDNNDTEKGRAANRRVQLYISGDTVTQAPITTATISSDKQSMVTEGLRPGSTRSNKEPLSEKKSNYDDAWLGTQSADIEWVLPSSEEIPAIPSTNIAIKHHMDQRVHLTLNGKTVPEVNFNGALKNNKGPALSSWTGVDLREGDNLFEATVIDQRNRIVSKLNRNIHYSSDPVRAEIVTNKSTLIADGSTYPVVAIRLYDKDNFPVHAGRNIEYNVNHPFQPERNREFITDNMAGSPSNRAFATVGDDGIALVRLEPSDDTDDLVITLPLADNKSVELKTRLKTKARDWILVGIAEGSTGYNTLSGNMENLEGNAAQNHLYQDDRVAFFAKGQILGKWLLTVAYDSEKEMPKKQGNNDPRLFQTIDPGTYYTVYGDTGQTGNGAPSSDKLYVRLENDEFYLLYGDYETGFKDTRLAKYERTLTGIKTRYQDQKYNVIVFASETSQSFVKDEFRGQSSTGPYKLSRTNVAMNTEKVTIEARDRFRSEVITSTKELARHSDYDIDYRDGTIVFREPVFSTDSDLNPQFVIVKYEAYDSSDTSITAGGRAEVNVNNDLKVGVTQVNEGRTGGDALLGGADVQYLLSDNTKLRLETAHTYDRKETASSLDGTAWLAEVEHQSRSSNSKLYFQETDSQFGLSQTNASENGMRKGGLESTMRATDNLNIKGQAYHQESLATNATRDLAEVQGEMRLSDTRLRAGVREVQDERGDGSEQRSEQLTTGISQDLFDDKVTLRADREINLNNTNDSIDFPDKTKLGADYHITRNTTLFVEQEVTNGDIRDTRHSRTGVKSTPWNGGEIYSGITKTSDESGDTTSANVAARQKWQLDQEWSIDVGAEESKTLSQVSGTPLNLNTGFANGSSEDFIAASLGITFNKESWMWTARVESRNGDIEDRQHISTSIQTSPQINTSMLASLSLVQGSRVTGEEQNTSDLQLGLAYRPNNTRWLLLDKLELKKENNTSPTEKDDSWRIINLLNANYKTGRWQTSLQYGAKTVKETINTAEYDQFVDLIGVETRYDITKAWDIGLHGNILRARDLKHYDYNSGLSVGHTIANNIWISLGYNFVGFRDEDFSRANYTSKGVFIKFRLKFDQQSAKEGLEWLKR